MGDDPVERFVAHGGPSPSRRAALAEALIGAHEAGRAAWPMVALELDAFVDHLAMHLQGTDDPEHALDRRLPADLYLACACALGHADAIAAFSEAMGGVLARVLATGRARGMDDIDLRQRFFERILVAHGGKPPRIASYTGEGSLKSWVRVVATRLGVDAERKKWEVETSLDERGGAAVRDPIAADPELALLRAQVKAPLGDAFAAALAELTPRQRNLLRLTILRGKSGTAIAEALGISRATAKRWIASAREELLTRTRVHLKQTLAVDTVELEQVLQLAASKLELSVGRLLGEVSELEPARPDDQ